MDRYVSWVHAWLWAMPLALQRPCSLNADWTTFDSLMFKQCAHACVLKAPFWMAHVSQKTSNTKLHTHTVNEEDTMNTLLRWKARRPPGVVSFTLLCLSLIFTLAITDARAADSYPAQPIRIVVPFGAGGLTDILARLIAEQLHVNEGWHVVVENKTGAGGNIGAAEVARSRPD